MIASWLLEIIILCYLCLLFFIAYVAERQENRGKSLVTNPYVYSLSLAVYCTSWTFYGSVGEAATSGLSFLPIYLGPTIMAILWGSLLLKIITIAKRHRITTISDFIAFRYGNSLRLSALVTVVTIIGITPYLGLQMKAIMSTFTIMAGKSSGTIASGWVIALVLGVFAMIFGARRLDSSERHSGLVLAIAFESLVKLVAFLAVGIFVTYGLFDGFTDIFARIDNSAYRHLLSIGDGAAVSYQEWASLLFLSMMAILFLPRQFHVAVVENCEPSHIAKAMWLFPLYMLLINIFVLPIAFGGILLGNSQLEADSFVLSIPLSQGSSALALLVFIGGLSAATGMVIVESLALSTMMMNSLVMPALLRFKYIHDFPLVILNIKRLLILGCVFLGYFFALSIGQFYSLVEIGLKSFEAVTIFAPSLLLGLYWKRGNRKGAMAGIAAGFLVWFYTLLMPALIRADVFSPQGFWGTLLTHNLLNPHALFGLTGLDKWTHCLFWQLLFNLSAYVGVSLFSSQNEAEERQGLLFVESYDANLVFRRSVYTISQIENILEQYVGKSEALSIVSRFFVREAIDRREITQEDLIHLRNEAERVLAGVLGSSISTIIFEDKATLTEEERGELSTSVKQMTSSLRLSRHELADANRHLAYLKEFSENVIESAPLGIVTIDAGLDVKYWNREMEQITGVNRAMAINQPIKHLLPWAQASAWIPNQKKEMVAESSSGQIIKLNVSPFKDLSGSLVAILENITEKRKMEESLLQTSKLASLGQFTAGISHEIGNPLASISSLVQELQSIDLHSPEELHFTHESLQTINDNLARIAKIVRSLGDFARISGAEKTFTDILQLLMQTLNLVKYDKRSRKIDFVTEAAPIPLLEVNADQFQQVFLNLVLNAIDAMPDGGRLEISVAHRPPWVVLRFTDSGCGIDEEVINRIFDPFFTTKPFGKGTGLGLSLCYGIIKDHNGRIAVESQKGMGATFKISLPMKKANE